MDLHSLAALLMLIRKANLQLYLEFLLEEKGETFLLDFIVIASMSMLSFLAFRYVLRIREDSRSICKQEYRIHGS